MGDPTKFQYLYEYYAFNVSLLLLVISEIVIYVYTNFRHQNGKSLRSIHIKCFPIFIRKSETYKFE